eukprot:808665_1
MFGHNPHKSFSPAPISTPTKRASQAFMTQTSSRSTSHGDLVLNVTIDCIVSIEMSSKCGASVHNMISQSGSTSLNIELLFVWCGIKDIAPIRSLRSLRQC